MIDGVSDNLRAQADLVIFLDVPRWRCFLRCAERTARHLFSQRPELPPGCPEWRIVPRLIKIIWRFPQHAGKRLQSASRAGGHIHVARNDDEAARLVEQLTGPAVPAPSAA